MPTYQYACTACDHRFETVQSFTDASLTECPECAGRLRKLYGSVGVVFKGSGFYRTDSRAKSEAKSEAKSPASSSATSSSDGAGSKESSSSTASSSSSSGGDKSNSSSSSTGTTKPVAKAS